jgi:hypothetical protein
MSPVRLRTELVLDALHKAVAQRRPSTTPRLHEPSQREPHWNVTVLVPSELVARLDVIGCEPDFWQ